MVSELKIPQENIELTFPPQGLKGEEYDIGMLYTP